MDTTRYREYLDKEMTIMGILSAVSIAAPAGVLNAILGDHSGLKKEFWDAGKFFIAVGSTFCVLAALLFYRQRSRLAWYYGQICLKEICNGDASLPARLLEWLREADSWETWIPYSWGFTALVLGGLCEYLLAMFFLLVPPHWQYLNLHLRVAKIAACCFFIIAAIVLGLLQGYVMKRYKFREDFWRPFFSDGRFLLGRRLPHEGVYTRLQPSPNHGVGVFAIRTIPEGTYIFEPDDEELIPIRAEEIEGLPPEIRQLYRDFCVLNGDVYQCPSTFNKLTPSWFLNRCSKPNVAADRSLKFYSVCEIQPGYELTADYDAYSDNPPA